MLGNVSLDGLESVRSSSDDGTCWLSATETAKRDSVAGVRFVTSCLSLLGSLSIILSVIARRQLFSLKVHPIFVLSVADCMLALLWMTGGILWKVELSPNSQVACLAISAATIVLECVSINLSLVYALFALTHLKANRLPSALFYPYQTQTVACHPLKTTAVYLLAWSLPMVLVSVLIFSQLTTFESVGKSSCWCAPDFANVLPMGLPTDRYNRSLKMLVLSYACVVFVHYLIVFPLLLAAYHCTLNIIKTIQPHGKQHRLPGYYGAATQVDHVRGESGPKHRVLLYLLTFTVTGFCNCLLSFVAIVHHSLEMMSHKPYPTLPLSTHTNITSVTTSLSNTILALFLLQSVTLPLQGFLNAIVYGWTRRDFLHAMAVSNSISHLESSSPDKTERDTPELLSGTYD